MFTQGFHLQIQGLARLREIGAREYAPSIGRFLSPDPLLDPGAPQSWNACDYADDTAVTTADPSGGCADIDGLTPAVALGRFISSWGSLAEAVQWPILRAGHSPSIAAERSPAGHARAGLVSPAGSEQGFVTHFRVNAVAVVGDGGWKTVASGPYPQGT
ncbi:RHS repeat-associated core domain-containing protein [Streptomyces sp. NPDC052107]|uniref:RHS repeat-associated core domain-containing protein n=1 Tax=Streptomyces sp. NPDC052107 TaxID=3155632 RepID=UPI0034125FD2